MIRRNKQTLEAPKRAREGVLIGKDQLFEAGLERVRHKTSRTAKNLKDL